MATGLRDLEKFQRPPSPFDILLRPLCAYFDPLCAYFEKFQPAIVKLSLMLMRDGLAHQMGDAEL